MTRVINTHKTGNLAVAAGGGSGGDEPPDLDALIASQYELIRQVAIRKFAIPRADVDDIVLDVLLSIWRLGAETSRWESLSVAITSLACREYWRHKDHKSVAATSEAESASVSSFGKWFAERRAQITRVIAAFRARLPWRS